MAAVFGEPESDVHSRSRGAAQFSTAAGDEARELLAGRLFTYAAVMLAMRMVAIVIVYGAESIWGFHSHWVNRPSGRAAIAGTLMLVALMIAVKKLRLSFFMLRVVDVAATLVLALIAAYGIPIEVAKEAGLLPNLVHQSAELKSALIIAHLLLLRAALIPSHPLRTALVGLAAAVPVCIATHFAYAQPGVNSEPRGLELVNVIVWAVFSILISTVCSGVIYGLRRRMRNALRMGEYTLEQKIGQGGMGVVYRARHALLRRPTAIKVLSPERMGQSAIGRFEREVQLTAKLSHPNIVSVYDFGRTEDGTFYYAMEFLDGVDLQQLVEDDGPQPPGRVRSILRQAADALAEAHAVHLIHRDIKPANMLLTQRASQSDVLKLVDFGLVKEFDTGTEALAQSTTHELRGTPLYMAPEAITAPETLGPKSDLYALGAVGYLLLSGAPVFEGQTAVAVLGKHAHLRPVPLSDRVTVPAKLEAVVMRCLEKRQELRFENARALALALEACDDVPAFTDEEALRWWKERRPTLRKARASSGSPHSQTLAVDLGGRAAAG